MFREISFDMAFSYQCKPLVPHERVKFINMSDIGRFVVYDETGASLRIVDTINQAIASSIYYAWDELNGRTRIHCRLPTFIGTEQLHYIEFLFNVGEIIKYKKPNKNSFIYLKRTKTGWKKTYRFFSFISYVMC